ncbi:MAG: M48 family metallopeptidase, partial [Porticoccaceae bacterium]|nr:M48 family metallopeptidase [Porticoccaceae bacterium]
MEIGFMEIDGHYLDGETSKRVPARLTITSVDERSLTLNVKSPDAAAQVFNLDYDQLTIQSRLGNTPREITFYLDAGTDVGGKNFGAKHSGIEAEAGAALRKNITTRQLFVTDNNDAIDELIGAIDGPGSSGLLHKLESHLGLIVFATLATIAIIWGTIVYGIPTAAKIIAYQMAGFVTEQFGGSLDLLDKTLFEPSNLQEDQLAHVRELVEPYLRSHEDLHPKLNFRAGMEANAFALPGGDIVLTDEFVKLAENDEELLAVVFHELGHLKYRHITRRALQGSMITLLVVFVTGDVSSVDLLTALPTLILDLSYSREFESEADL